MKINEVQRENIAPEKLEEPTRPKEDTGKKSWWWIVRAILITIVVAMFIIGPIIGLMFD